MDDNIDSRHARYARVLLKASYENDEQGKVVRCLSMIGVRTGVWLAPTAIEVRVRRLRLLAGMLVHSVLFATLLVYVVVNGATFPSQISPVGGLSKKEQVFSVHGRGWL